MTKPSKPRVRLNSVSAKQLAKRQAAGESFLRSSVRPSASKNVHTRKPIKAKPRKASEYQRIYGSRARVAWVKGQSCAVPWCGRIGCDNAHSETGGMGRKANFTTIAPLCRSHHREMHDEGCIEHNPPGTRTVYVFTIQHLRAAAVNTNAAWQAYASQHPTRQRGRSA